MEAILMLFVLVLWLAFIFCMAYMWWKIFEKTGYHGALGILMLVPIANLVMMAILAFREWPIHKELNAGDKRAPASLPVPLIVLIVVLGSFPIVALLAAIAIPNLLRARITANEAVAEATVKNISSAIETYAAANGGAYPADEYDLTKANPPYLKESYNNKTIEGYYYTERFDPKGYAVVARPSSCGTSGIKNITATTGGILSNEKCKRVIDD